MQLQSTISIHVLSIITFCELKTLHIYRATDLIKQITDFFFFFSVINWNWWPIFLPPSECLHSAYSHMYLRKRMHPQRYQEWTREQALHDQIFWTQAFSRCLNLFDISLLRTLHLHFWQLVFCFLKNNAITYLIRWLSNYGELNDTLH